jgi:hypothetical protein
MKFDQDFILSHLILNNHWTCLAIHMDDLLHDAALLITEHKLTALTCSEVDFPSSLGALRARFSQQTERENLVGSCSGKLAFQESCKHAIMNACRHR